MVDIQTVSIAIASAGVFAAAIYYIFLIRHQTRLRQTDLVMRLYSTFGSKEFQVTFTQIGNLQFKSPEDFLEKYGDKTNIEVWATCMSVAAFFEQVGILLHRRLIDVSLVDDLLGIDVKQAWEKMVPIIKDRRKRLGTPKIWEWFEYLYNEMEKREQQPASKTA